MITRNTSVKTRPGVPVGRYGATAVQYERGAVQSERGAVALLTTIVISMLLVIITGGIITLMAAEVRQSNDAEQSVRAFYAAQSGVEDALSRVQGAAAGPLPADQTCTASSSATTQNLDLDATQAGVVGWTCQEIKFSSTPTGTLNQPDDAIQIDPGNTAFGSLTVEWDTKQGQPASYYAAPANFTPAAAWQWAPPVELTVVEYPLGTFNPSVNNPATGRPYIETRNALVRPSNGILGAPQNIQTLLGTNPFRGSCAPGGSAYHCRMDFTGFSAAKNYVLRLRSRYAGTGYRLTFHAGASTASATVAVPDGTASIDVTAKAGDVYRRVVYKVPYKQGALGGLNYVIFADGDVCKDFSVLNGAIATPGCPY